MRKRVASNPVTPCEILWRLAEGGLPAEVARNPNAPSEILEHLAEDKNKWVRAAVARNPKTPSDVLQRLAEDKEQDVRREVAHNPGAPIQALQRLANDKNSDVVKKGAKMRLLVLTEKCYLDMHTRSPFAEEMRDDTSLASETLALWLACRSPHETAVALPAYLLSRKDLLGAIVRLCRVPPPSLEDAQRHLFYRHSAKYRAVVAAVYAPQMTWFDAQMYSSHLLRPIYPRLGQNGLALTL